MAAGQAECSLAGQFFLDKVGFGHVCITGLKILTDKTRVGIQQIGLGPRSQGTVPSNGHQGPAAG
jgi:hypothetical protein